MEEAGVGRQQSVVLSADATDRVSHEVLIEAVPWEQACEHFSSAKSSS